MKIAVLHNAYRRYSGEEAAVEREMRLLGQHGHEVRIYSRSSAELSQLRLGKLRAFVAGVYAPGSRAAIHRFLEQHAPTIVHFHNLFPLISPVILPELREAGIPAIMTVHNYRLVCPTGLHLSKKSFTVCEKCCGGKEYWCILRNCEANMPIESGKSKDTIPLVAAISHVE
jgi:glycosyltransferase involved in cell wall biosynthesis